MEHADSLAGSLPQGIRCANSSGAFAMIVSTTVLGVCLAARPGPAPCGASLTVRPRLAWTFAFRGADTLGVTVTFDGSASDIDTILVPASWAGERLNVLAHFRALSAETVIEGDSGRQRRVVRHRPGATVRLAYDIVKDWREPLRHPLQFHPVFRPDYFQANGSNLLVFPARDGRDRVAVSFQWDAAPESWVLATSFGTVAQARGACQVFEGPWEAVRQALFAAGQFQVHTFEVRGRPVTLAINGTWTFSDSAAMATLQRAMAPVRAFWHDDRFPYFLVTWNSYDQDHGSSDGSAFTNAIWFYMSRLDSVQAMTTQLAHEAFHEWDPHQMGVIARESRPVQWFTEGFTSYYAALIMYRAGALSLAEYVRNLNADLRIGATSTDPYVRGRLIAAWLDGAVREGSGGKTSLDDLMKRLLRPTDQLLTLRRILDTLGAPLTAEQRAALDQMAESGPISAPLAGPLAGCATVSLDSVADFDMGFDVPASRATHVITGARADGPAYAAGLRDGQPARSFSYHSGEPEEQARVGITVGQTNQTIAYFPRGKRRVAPQLHVQAGNLCKAPSPEGSSGEG